jgi:hypothetical protein
MYSARHAEDDCISKITATFSESLQLGLIFRSLVHFKLYPSQFDHLCALDYRPLWMEPGDLESRCDRRLGILSPEILYQHLSAHHFQHSREFGVWNSCR